MNGSIPGKAAAPKLDDLIQSLWNAPEEADLVGFIVDLWKADQNQPALDNLNNWLAKLYKGGDEELRTCIVNATLEHVFQHKTLRKLFSDWKLDPELRQAYDLACFHDTNPSVNE